MEELEVYIWYVMCKFKNNKNTTETNKKISSVYNHDVITNWYVQNWFSKFHSGNTSLRDEPRSACSSDLT